MVTHILSNQTEPATDHLDSVEDGCGCTEIWEHLSERRDGEAADG
jgi:hypothetical protein